MSEVFQNMLVHENLVDVTLACEGASIKAHKMILAACSPYFQNLFMANPCKHPIVILKDVKFNDLKAIIDFIYSGEVNIPQDQLNSLLKTAETLKIKGLADFGEKQQVTNSVSLKNNSINLNSNNNNNINQLALPLNYPNFNFNKKRKRQRLQYALNNNLSAINHNSQQHKTYSKNSSVTIQNNSVNNNHSSNANLSIVQQQRQRDQQQQQQQQPETTKEEIINGSSGGIVETVESSDEEDDEGNNSSSKSVSIEKNFFGGVNSPNFKGLNQQQHSTGVFDNDNDNDREDSEEFEPTKLLEQSMSTPEQNTGVDYSPENNQEVESGDDDEAEENSKGFIMDDEYSSNNSNNNLNIPVGMNNFANQFISNNSNNSLNGSTNNVSRSIEEYEQLLAEIQQKNLTTCPICSKEFIKKSKLIRHYHTHFSDFRPKFSCVFCGKLFTTQDWCKRHALNCQLKQYQHVSHLDLFND